MDGRTWPGAAYWVVLLLLVLAAVPAAARHPDAFTFHSNPFELAARNSGRQLLQLSGNSSCPTNDVAQNKPVDYIRVQQGLTTPTDLSTVSSIKYDALNGPDWGWSVPSPRPSTDSWTLSTVNPGSTPSDFWSVMCNGATGNVVKFNGEYTRCTQANQNNIRPADLAGMVHVRHTCDGTLWVLVYVFMDRILFPDPMQDNIWIRWNLTLGNGVNAGEKSVQYVGDGNNGACDATCINGAPACTGNLCSICCIDMWPIVDPSASPTWIGFLAKVRYDRKGNNFAWDTMKPHFNFGPSNDANGNTAAGAGANISLGVCMNCTESPTTQPTCNPPGITSGDTSFCPNPGSVVIDFTVTSLEAGNVTTVASFANEGDTVQTDYGCNITQYINITQAARDPTFTVRVVCNGPFPTAPDTFLVELTARNPFSDGDGFCGPSVDATVTANPSPTFNITANAPDPFCAADGNVSVSFTVQSTVGPVGVSASNWNLTTTATPNSVTCTGPTIEPGAGMDTWQVTYNCSAAPDSTVKLSGNVKNTSTSCTASDEDTATLDGTPDPYLLIVAGDVEPYCKGATSAIVNFNITSSLPPANWTYNPVETTGPTCVPNPLGPVVLVDLGNGNKTYEWSFNCTNNDGLPATFNVTLNINATDDIGCDAQYVETIIVTETPLPFVDLKVDPVEPFCAPDGSVKVEFIVNTTVNPGLSDGVPDWVLTATVLNETDAESDANPNCTLEGIVSFGSEWKVTYNCTADATPPGLPIPFKLDLSVKVTDTAAPFCSNSDSARQTPRGSTLPIVNVTADAYAPFCAPDGQVYVSFTVESTVPYNETFWGLSVNVTDPDTGVPDCWFQRATENTRPSGTTLGNVTVVYWCDKTGGLPDPFSVELKVDVTNEGGCDATDTAISVLDGFQLPELNITANPVPPFCVDDEQVTVNYTVCSNVTYSTAGWLLQPTVNNGDGVSCKGPPQVVALGNGCYTVSYNCTSYPNNLPTLFTLNLNATVTNVGGCVSSANTNSTLDGDDLPVVSAAPVPLSAFCTNRPVSFKYRVNSTVPYNTSAPNWFFTHVVDPASRASNVSITCQGSSIPTVMVINETLGMWEVVYKDCTVGSSEALSMNFTVRVTTPGDCNTRAEAILPVDASCCVSNETAFARGGNDGFSNATCFTNLTTNTTNKKGIQTTTALCNSERWGWQNMLSGPDADGETYKILAGAGQCRGGTDVGNVTITCVQTAATGSNVTMMILGQTGAVGVVNHYYLGCEDITKCNPPDFQSSTQTANRIDVSATANAITCGSKCGGIVNVAALTQGTLATFTLNCGCSGLRWVLHQGEGTYFTDGVC